MIIRKRFILVCFLIALILAAGGYAVWRLYPGKYTAYALLQVSSNVPRILFQTADNTVESDHKRYRTTQLALVKSQLVLDAALRNAKGRNFRMVREQTDPRAWLHDNLKVEFVADSEVMEIALSGDDPKEVAGLVNAVKIAYMQESVDTNAKRRMERFDML